MRFDEATDPVWMGIGPFRQRHSENKLLDWVRLAEIESIEGDLCGARIYEKGFLWRTEVAQVIIGYQYPSYVVQVWRRRREPVIAFVTDPDLNQDEAVSAVVFQFEAIVERLASVAMNGRLRKNFPPEWVGRSAWEVYRSPR